MEEIFRIGSIYESSTHGRVEYRGIDVYMGQSTYYFYSLTYNQKCYWLEEDLENHFDDIIRFDVSKVEVTNKIFNSISKGIEFRKM